MPGSREKMRSFTDLQNRQVLLLLLSGTIVRLVFGCCTKAWLGSPDQLAWGLDLDEMIFTGSWSYFQLAHAPHEGASVFISLISLLFRPFFSWIPPLSFTALAIDTAGRFMQVTIVQKICGNETALWFALWTVLAVPLLLPWATVNFGLHALLSFVPFLFCWLVFAYGTSVYFPVWCGVFCAVAISLSYNSMILAIATILYFLFNGKNKFKNTFLFISVLSIALFPHVWLRVLANGGSGGDPFAIRGILLNDFFNRHSLLNLCCVWFTSLPASLLLSGNMIVVAFVFLLLLTGTCFYIVQEKDKNPIHFFIPSILLLFLGIYALSPFYGKEYGSRSYVYYRHLSYIIPLLVAVVIHGFLKAGEWKKYLLTGWLLLCGMASLQFMFRFPKAVPTYQSAGWILANKYGTDMAKLFSIHSVTPVQYQQELVTGFGWGITARLLQKNTAASIAALVSAVNGSPKQFQPGLRSGIHAAFAKNVTPVLNAALLAVIDSGLNSNSNNRSIR